MSYTKQTWNTGDIITAQKLNHMEDGIVQGGGGSLLVKFTFDPDNETYTCNKTFAEVYAAVQAETYVYAHEDQNEKYLALVEAYPQGELPGCVRFEHTHVEPYGITTFGISLTSDNTIEYNNSDYPNS